MTDQRSFLLDASRVAAIVVALGWIATGYVALCIDAEPKILAQVILGALTAGVIAGLVAASRTLAIGWSGWGALATIVAGTTTILAGVILVLVGRAADPSELAQLRSVGPRVWLGFVAVTLVVAVGIALELRKRMVRVFCTLALLVALVGLSIIGTHGDELDVLDATRDRATVLNNERLALVDAVATHNDDITTEDEVRDAADALLAAEPADDDALARAVLAYLETPEQRRADARIVIDAITTPTDTTAMTDLVALLDGAEDPVAGPSDHASATISWLCQLGAGTIDLAAEQASCHEQPDHAGTMPPPVALLTCPTPTDGSEPVALRVDLAERSTDRTADLLARVASCELTATRVAIGEAKGDQLEAAQREVDTALAAIGQPAEPVPLPDAIVAGAAAVTATVAPDDGTPIELSAAGWLVLAGLLLIGYRWLEIQAGLHRTGPVTFQFEGKDKTESVEAIHFREAVLRNVREPGAVPGSTALAPVTDLLGDVTVTHGPLIKTALAAVQAVFATPSGYTIAASWRSDAAPRSDPDEEKDGDKEKAEDDAKDDGPAAVFVQISETRTGRQLASTTVSGDDANVAARKAGYWCAGWIIARSRDVPSWARWDESASTALAAYDWDDGRNTTIDQLKEEISRAPTTGVLLVALGYRYDLDKRFGEAMELYARTRATHPRYVVGRYRASASLAMLASGYALHWAPLPEVTKDQIARHLNFSKDSDTPHLVAAAKRLAESDRAFVRPWLVVWASLRRAERVYWLLLLRSDLRRQLSLLARSGQLIMGVREGIQSGDSDAKEREALEREAERADTSYQLAYNLACYRSLRGEADEAISWLYRALDHRYSGQLTKEWLLADPDLERVRTECPTEFAEVVARAASDPYSNESTSSRASRPGRSS